jgi:hypothetical protein
VDSKRGYRYKAEDMRGKNGHVKLHGKSFTKLETELLLKTVCKEALGQKESMMLIQEAEKNNEARVENQRRKNVRPKN